MRIRWVRYAGRRGPRYFLILDLGERGGHTYALATSEIPAGEIDIIRANVDVLDKMGVSERVAWLKLTCPVSMRKAFRSLSSDGVSVVNSYDIGRLL